MASNSSVNRECILNCVYCKTAAAKSLIAKHCALCASAFDTHF